MNTYEHCEDEVCRSKPREHNICACDCIDCCKCEAFGEGAAAERARIVLYLREMGSDDEANEIKRGDHLWREAVPLK